MSKCPDPAAPTLNPCEQLKAAQAQLAALAAGRHVRLVETPQLGRVEYSTARVGDLQRIVDGLKRECAEYLGISDTRFSRRPISLEAEP